MHLKHQHHIQSSAIQATHNTTQHNTMTSSTSTSTSTLLYDKACIAAQKANEKRFKARSLSVPDELYWYNNNTNWSALSRKEFREVMILMETITMRFYDDYGDCVYPNRSAAIKKFWAEEWDCEYSPESGEWWDLSSNERIESETEKKARRQAAKAAEKEAKKAKAAAKAEKKAAKKQQQQQQQQSYQYNDEEEELYIQALAQQEQKQEQKQEQQQQQQQQQQSYDEWYDAEEDAYAEAYAKARAADELKQQQEAQTYLDQKEEKEEKELTPRVACQPVLYVEELTDVAGDPDWRAYIYYDARIRRYVFKGTRRSLKTLHCKKTSYPEVKLCFRSSREMASFLCASTDVEMNISMFAMASATVKDATFAELYALPARGSMTELFGYDRKYMRYSTFVDYLCMLRDVDASHSNFAAF